MQVKWFVLCESLNNLFIITLLSFWHGAIVELWIYIDRTEAFSISVFMLLYEKTSSIFEYFFYHMV